MIGRAAPSTVYRVHTVAELAELLAANPDVVLLGGGTLEVPSWQDVGPPDAVVYLPSIQELRIRDASMCGAAVTMAEVAADVRMPLAMRQAAASIGGPAVRNMATVGGNLAALRPGCLAVALLTLDAAVWVCAPNDVKALVSTPLEQTLVGLDSPIAAVSWSHLPSRRTAFTKLALRAAGGPNVVSVATRLDTATEQTSCAIAIGSTGVAPHRLRIAERAFIDSDENPSVSAEIAGEEAIVDSDHVASEGHCRAAIRVLVGRLLVRMLEGEKAHGGS